ncbi:S-adenosylhomocysteine deaminase Methylthioadenosine deaminase [Desulfurella amilsii]|uniref:S-adenosylhomocysteine deaminase Methylthioadenosine deaminase n=1 Tax=Desulfurella amilsii TaxID=1562698 RepID=A0A1X4XXW7_9BACT|nr:amidohydrolase [Desulfurella amilsii]OSS42386.1 S-adenosylhomocysteine deaminase Methylthioadenosine deaminase [Desulfurella amilsii]
MILIKNALNLDGFRTSILIEGNKILKVQSDVAQELSPQATIIDASNMLAISGFFNAHTHAAMTIFRGYQDDLALQDWLNKIFKLEAAYVDETMVYWCSKLACLEMVSCGTTGFMDMYFFEDQVAKSALDVGLRVVIGEGLLSFQTPFCADFKEGLKKTFDLKEKYKDHPKAKVSFAPHSLYTVEKNDLELLSNTIDKNDFVQIHLAENLTEVNTVLSKFGQPPTFVLEEFGLLNSNTYLAHCVHLTDDEIELIQKRNAHVIHNPQSNMKLSSGISSVCKMIQKGVDVCLGTDGCASNNNLDMIEELRSAALLQKLFNPSYMNAKLAVRIAQNFGGFFDVALSEGKLADVVLIDLDAIEAIPLYNPASFLAYAANSKSVDTVIIDGKIIYKNKEFVDVDVQEVKFNVKKIAKKIGSL